MKVRLRDMLSDLVLVLAALVPTIVADSNVLHLGWRDTLLLSTVVVLIVCAASLWELQQGTYERLPRRTRIFIGLLLMADVVLFALSGFHSAAIGVLGRAFSYCVTVGVIIFVAAEGIRQSRAKQTIRSVKDNGTV